MTFDTDTLYIALRTAESADAAEVAPDVVLDYDANASVLRYTDPFKPVIASRAKQSPQD